MFAAALEVLAGALEVGYLGQSGIETFGCDGTEPNVGTAWMFTMEFQGTCCVKLDVSFSLQMILVEASVARFACDLVRYWKLLVAGAAGLMVLSYIPGCWVSLLSCLGSSGSVCSVVCILWEEH